MLINITPYPTLSTDKGRAEENKEVDLTGKELLYKIAQRRDMMALDPQILEILACPVCKEEVKLTADDKGLKCVKCHRVYPIKDDIPVMLIDEATIDSERPTKD